MLKTLIFYQVATVHLVCIQFSSFDAMNYCRYCFLPIYVSLGAAAQNITGLLSHVTRAGQMDWIFWISFIKSWKLKVQIHKSGTDGLDIFLR